VRWDVIGAWIVGALIVWMVVSCVNNATEASNYCADQEAFGVYSVECSP
jgi:hypothetical protein